MPPRRRPVDRGTEFDRWADGFRERHGIPPREPFVVPFWRRLPDFIDVSAFRGRPDIGGYRFHPDGRVEAVGRGDV